MAYLQKQVDTAFAELDVVEEMLRPLVVTKSIHEHEDGFRIPITQTEPFQEFGRHLETRLNELEKKIVSLIGPESYQRRFIDSSMLFGVTKIWYYAEQLKMVMDGRVTVCAIKWRLCLMRRQNFAVYWTRFVIPALMGRIERFAYTLIWSLPT